MANTGTKLFRQSALDRLSSPEQLDRMVTLTRPAGWAALLASCGLIAAAVGWGIAGTVSTYVDGDGLIISSGGQVLDAVALASGRLASVSVHVGDTVRRGEVVATLDQTDTERAWRNAQAQVAELEAEDKQLQADLANQAAGKEKSFAEQEAALRQTIAAATQRAAFLKQTIASLVDLAKQGVVPPLRVEDARTDAAAVDQQISQSNTELTNIQAQRQALAIDQATQRMQSANKVADAQRQAQTLAAELARDSAVASPADGTVTEIDSTSGEVVPLGGPVLSIESAGTGLQLIAFVPPDNGKMVLVGSTVRIEPDTAKKEEFGTLLGTVQDISAFPATMQGMRSILQNDRLVEQFSERGPPYIAHIALEPDASTPSGYRWSTGTGPDIKLGSGTLAKVEVTVREQAPITLVIPTLRKMTGIAG